MALFDDGSCNMNRNIEDEMTAIGLSAKVDGF